MKILILTNHSYMLYRFRRDLIRQLLKDGHEVVLSMPFVGHEDDFKQMGCKTIHTQLDRRGINPLTDLKLLKHYYQLLKQERPDKVITYSIKPNCYGGMMCQVLKIPYYVNVQGLGTAFEKPILASFVTFLYKLALRKANIVFFENKKDATSFLERHIIKENKMKVLSGAGVNLDHYQATPYPQDGLIHFLYLGRIMKEKGVDELFEAYSRLKKENEHIILDVVGFFEDEYKDKIKQLEEQNLIIFHGFQQQVRPYYANAHCVILPSYHEGMSNVLLEASSMARPVITTNISGCKEAVDDGITGYLCEVKDANSLYTSMKQFLSLSHQEKEEMGKQARLKMEREFSKHEVIFETLSEIMK